MRSDDIAQIHWTSVKDNLARDNTADVQQIFDEARHMRDLTLQDVMRAHGARLSKVSEPQHLHGPAHRTKRIAQLVREHREKFVLRSALPLDLRQSTQIGHDQSP